MFTAAVAFLFVTALHANDSAAPTPATKNAAPAVSTPAPASANAQPDSTAALPAPSPAPASASDPSQPAPSAQPAPAPQGSVPSDRPYPKVELFLGYSFWRAMPTSTANRMSYLHGGATNVAYNFNRWFGLVFDFSGFATDRVTLISPAGNTIVKASGSAYTYTLGPRFSYRRYERVTPFVQALFGGVYATTVTGSGCGGCTLLKSDNAFAGMAGIGFDVKLTRHFSLRPFEGDYLLTDFRDPYTAGGSHNAWQHNVRFSGGIVIRFGGESAPAPVASVPVVATCSADPAMVYAGSGDFVAVRAQASDSLNSTFTYSWSASEGAVDGSGAQVRWSSADRMPGAYTVTVRVYNGGNGSAECSANIQVAMRPNRPPTISCTADHGTVTVGDPVQITAIASDPDGDPLTFSWSASGGSTEGSGSSVAFRTGGLSPGTYTVDGHVDDGRTGTADCTVNIAVQAAPPSAEQVQLETRLALHSIYFATARPTEADPSGGLVDSQQQVLLSLATDFNRYLTFMPQAHLILEGHADRRGSVEYNQALTQRRVDRTKSFLTDHGVPAANIETRAVGKQDNLDAAQVKQLVDQDPDLGDGDRRRIDANLRVIVLANNRRVDVSLSTTGQQSVRQYPFNAKDSLTLLSTSGGKRTSPAAPPAKSK